MSQLDLAITAWTPRWRAWMPPSWRAPCGAQGQGPAAARTRILRQTYDLLQTEARIVADQLEK
jgi:hypothetical protein